MKTLLKEPKIRPWRFLFPLVFFYRFFWLLGSLRMRWQCPVESSWMRAHPLVVVGSRLVGGGGRSSAVMALARASSDAGLRVAVLCTARYKKMKQDLFLLEENAIEWSDEAELFRRSLRGVPGVELYLVRDRLTAWEILARRNNYDLLISDGGLEDRCLDSAHLVSIEWPGVDSFWRLLPAGELRSLQRDLLDRRVENWMADESGKSQRKISFNCLPPKNHNGIELTLGSHCVLLCAIGRPEIFVRDMEDMGFSVSECYCLPDHFFDLESRARALLVKKNTLVCTEKDAVKLSEKTLQNSSLYVVGRKVHFGFDLDHWFASLLCSGM